MLPEIPVLDCSSAVRINEQLGQRVNDLLTPWVDETGIFPGHSEKIRAADCGRFAMLCHPDTDDPQRLLLPAKCLAAMIAVDDHYCDDGQLGAIPQLVASRLSIAMAAIEPALLNTPYAVQLEEALAQDRVLRALRGYMKHLASCATAAQVARERHELAALFVAMSAEAAWRINHAVPAVWEYLAHRQINSFLPLVALIDIVGGYEIDANLYASVAVRRATTLASSAATLANDIYSAAVEARAEIGDFNLCGLLAATQRCSPQEAMDQAVSIHDDLMRAYKAQELLLLRNAPPLLKRYLAGLHAWVAGCREWHEKSARYRIES